MTENISILNGAYTGKRGLITGSGPSLLRLDEEALSAVDVILTVNYSILKVRKLRPSVPVFMLWKDAGHKDENCVPTCKVCTRDCAKIYPKEPEKYIVHEPESHLCYPEYFPRYIYNNSQFGYPWNRPSIASAIKIMELFGISHIVFAGCDSVFGNSQRCYDGESITGDDKRYLEWGYGNVLLTAISECNFKSCTFIR